MSDTNQKQTTDRDLLESAGNGDSEAFREIVERHQAMIYRTCLRIIKNQADAEDATQATFIVFHKKCRNLNPGVVLGGWLYRTAELVCREFIRSSKRRLRREEETIAMKKTTVQDHTAIWKTLQPELDQAMIALPKILRDVVVLRHFEGKSTNETAVEMGLTDSAVTTRLSRAIDQLRDWFHRRGIVLGTGVLSVALAENANAGTVPATLTPSILGATGASVATAAVSANTSLMVNGTLAKMGSIAWSLWEAIGYIFWIDCMISWIRRGCPIPRWVHVLAVSLLGAGLMTSVALGVMGIFTVELAVGCIVIPPIAAYVGWLWLFGPEHALESTSHENRQ